jgi:hypothetical protein
VSFVFKPIDDPRDSFLDERDVEVDQQAEALVSQPEIGEELFFVNRGEDLD